MKTRIAATVLVLGLTALGLLAIVHKKRQLASEVPPARAPIPVHVATVRHGATRASVATLGLIQPGTSATVSAQTSGALREVRVKEGDVVAKGQVMARIDASLLEDAALGAQARAVAMEEDLTRQQAVSDRDRVLFENAAISRQSFEASKAQLEAVKATAVAARRAFESARTQRSYADVTAPYAGVVSARLVEPGDLATPGKPLFTIHAPGPVKVVSKLSQEAAARLRAGDDVTFMSDGRTLAGKTSRIYPSLDVTHLATVETDLTQSPFGLAPGATLSATYAATRGEGLLLPASALLQGLNETLVVRVRERKADPVPVTLVAESDAEVVVAGPLAAGDQVVTGLPSELMALTAGAPLAPVER